MKKIIVLSSGCLGCLAGIAVFILLSAADQRAGLALGPGGVLSNSTLFLDANHNGVLDSSEFRTKTDAQGGFRFPESPKGRLCLIGGRMRHAGASIPFTGLFKAPGHIETSGITLISPLTSLIQAGLEKGYSRHLSELIVKTRFQLPEQAALLSRNKHSSAGNASQNPEFVNNLNWTLCNTINRLIDALAAAQDTPLTQSTTQQMYDSMFGLLFEHIQTPQDLSDPEVIGRLMRFAFQARPSLLESDAKFVENPSWQQHLASEIAASNTRHRHQFKPQATDGEADGPSMLKALQEADASFSHFLDNSTAIAERSPVLETWDSSTAIPAAPSSAKQSQEYTWTPSTGGQSTAVGDSAPASTQTAVTTTVPQKPASIPEDYTLSNHVGMVLRNPDDQVEVYVHQNAAIGTPPAPGPDIYVDLDGNREADAKLTCYQNLINEKIYIRFKDRVGTYTIPWEDVPVHDPIDITQLGEP